jgi:hypothetical protein
VLYGHPLAVFFLNRVWIGVVSTGAPPVQQQSVSTLPFVAAGVNPRFFGVRVAKY